MRSSAYEGESGAASLGSDGSELPVVDEDRERRDGADDGAAQEAGEESPLDRARRPESAEERALRVRRQLRGWLIGGGLTVGLLAAGGLLVHVNEAFNCGIVAENSVTRTLERLTRPGELPVLQSDDRFCAAERLPMQLTAYGAIQLGLIAIAVGLFLRPNPRAPMPTTGRARWASLGLRTVAVLLPAVLLASEAIVVVTTEAHPGQEWGLSRAKEGKHRALPSACELVDLSKVRGLVRSYWKFDITGSWENCSLHWRSPDGSDTFLDVRTAYDPRNEDLAAEIRRDRRKFCDRNIRLAADACVSPPKKRTDIDLPGRQRTLVVADGNLEVHVEVATDRRQVLSEQRMRMVASAVREGIAR